MVTLLINQVWKLVMMETEPIQMVVLLLVQLVIYFMVTCYS
jgi:hypothetical protein